MRARGHVGPGSAAREAGAVMKWPITVSSDGTRPSSENSHTCTRIVACTCGSGHGSPLKPSCSMPIAWSLGLAPGGSSGHRGGSPGSRRPACQA